MINVLGLITARGGSKGLPRKHLRLLGNKPLIAWTVEAARRSTGLTRIVVSTDDPEIAAVAREFGAEAPFLRPAELAQDNSPHILACEHALDWLREHDAYGPECVMLLQPTSPFRSEADIDGGIKLLLEGNACAVVSVCDAKPHPMKTYGVSADGSLVPFVPCELPDRRRQDLPRAFADNGAVYLNRTDVLQRERTYFPSGAIPFVMPPERSVDVDTEWDLEVANLLLAHRLGTTRGV